jgi:outer membrane protein assembly factor BamB
VVVLDDGGRLHGLDLGTGATRWRHEARGRVRGPLTAGAVAAVGVGPRLVGLDPATGASAWSARLVAEVEAVHGLGEVILATTQRRSLEAIDAGNGRHRWVHRPVPAPHLAPVPATGLLWMAAAGGRLVGLDPATGGSRAPGAPGLALTGMAGDDDQLVITAAGPAAVVSLDHVGRTRWHVALRQAAPAPALEPGAVHVVDPGGHLTTLESANGALRGRAQLAFDPAGAPVAAAGLVLVTDRSGTVWAHRPPQVLP